MPEGSDTQVPFWPGAPDDGYGALNFIDSGSRPGGRVRLFTDSAMTFLYKRGSDITR